MGTEPDDPGAPEGNDLEAPAGDGGGAPPRPVQPPVFGTGDEGPTESLVAGTMGDRCVNCGAPLAADQRYCVNCGERRGAPRFTLPAATATAGSSEPSEPPPSKRGRRPRASSGATLVAGVGTLLLALGVGVLIGHGAGSTKTVQQPRAQVIKVNEGGGGGGGAATTSAASNAGNTSGGSSASKKSKTGGGAKHKSGGGHHHAAHKAKSPVQKAPKPTKQEAQAAQSAANKVTGGSDVNNAPATVTVGGSCTGSGCNPKTHKFSGNFFGGG
jgi:hypothetical protein